MLFLTDALTKWFRPFDFNPRVHEVGGSNLGSCGELRVAIFFNDLPSQPQVQTCQCLKFLRICAHAEDEICT